MIVDSSAIVAIVFNEPRVDALLDALATARQPRMSAASLLETSIVIDSRRNPIASRPLDDLTASREIVSVTELRPASPVRPTSTTAAGRSIPRS